MFAQFLNPTQVDIPRQTAGMVGNVLGISALVAFIIGPWTFQACELEPQLWAIAMQHHYLVVLGLLLCFCITGQALTGAVYWSSRRISRAVQRWFAGWPRSSTVRSLLMCLSAVIAFFTMALAYEWAWWSAGGGSLAHDREAIGLIEIGFSFLIVGSLISALSAISFSHPQFADRVIPSDKREQAWCMLAIEAWAAAGIGAFSCFTLMHREDLVDAGLSEWLIWTGLALSGAIVAGGIALFVRLSRQSPT